METATVLTGTVARHIVLDRETIGDRRVETGTARIIRPTQVIETLRVTKLRADYSVKLFGPVQTRQGVDHKTQSDYTLYRPNGQRQIPEWVTPLLVGAEALRYELVTAITEAQQT
jgi:hypothetical protein